MKTNKNKPLPPVISATLPKPRPLYTAISIEEFRDNEQLREAMQKAIDDILNLAFAAADKAEEDYATIAIPTDVARDAFKNAERVGIARYKRTLLSLANKRNYPSQVEPNYSGVDEFDKLAQ